MFPVYGVQGRIVAGSLEQLRQLSPVAAVSRTRRVAAVSSEGEPGSGAAGAASGHAAQALAAYGASAERARAPLQHVADVMSRPARAVPVGASVGQAWQLLAQQGIGQAPVVEADGALVGLVSRAELLPPAMLAQAAADAGAWQALLAQPVASAMWTPVPATQPDTDLRHAAALLLATGLPGLPVLDEAGQLLGFVSRTDLLRAMATDPPLDLWG